MRNIGTATITAVVSYWNPVKRFGFLRSQTAIAGGYKIENYFLHSSQIIFQAHDEVQVGDYVRFNLGFRGKRAGDLISAIQAEVFENAEQCETLDLIRAVVDDNDENASAIEKPAAITTTAVTTTGLAVLAVKS